MLAYKNLKCNKISINNNNNNKKGQKYFLSLSDYFDVDQPRLFEH